MAPGKLPHTTRHPWFVAENTHASAFRLAYIEANVIHEPSTIALMVVGLGGLALPDRRR